MKKFAFAVTAVSGVAALATHHDAEASTQHTVKNGESLWTIADQYGASVEELKSSNNISGNMIFPGQVITVNGSQSAGGSGSQATATSGSTYTVKNGDSLAVIAQQNGVTVDQLMKSNNLQGYIIYPGQTLNIAGGSGANTSTVPTNNNNTQPTQGGNQSFNDQNLYDWGQCTYYVFDRRGQAGSSISTYWGDAKYWAGAAQADGYRVDNAPAVGAIMQSTAGQYGHVSYVESVKADGSLLVSEMNYNTPPGVQDYRTIPASEVYNYSYIH
ncbi:LysM peptidoglycan-binding domain-containing protein [Mammaliicoccus stepanovicii]|uniref:Secretory antigen SsaA n=1 Tax=Mammaliicoccus stepanovicii TaxID=643214 RepID=A0A239YGD6_9STAP|nr:CHAP domain-containing protein [Mammaliicoccus stepanovicii]PNZ74724.1 peptidase M23 [Mammaliicoccus stepanovicii]GGI40773.1 peptidase M23 [Mammaliicoccus stepanovicii]SNV58045.1 Secretory antigen precursor SsaA [Mammaliicoccus stepanovicii]